MTSAELDLLDEIMHASLEGSIQSIGLKFVFKDDLVRKRTSYIDGQDV